MKDLIFQIAIVLIMTYLLFRIRHFILTFGKSEKKYDCLYVWQLNEDDTGRGIDQSQSGSATPIRNSTVIQPTQAQRVEFNDVVVSGTNRVKRDLRHGHSKGKYQ